jgi:putative phage-type endonuclease
MICDLQQNTPEWLEWRRDKIGASEVAAILGVSPYDTAYTLWERKLGLIPEKEKTFAMQRGHDLEDKIRNDFIKESGIDLEPKVLTSEEHPFLIASLDGISLDGKTVIEIKCPNKEDHFLAKKGEVPSKYFPQLQHQCFVCGIENVIYLSHNGIETVSVVVNRWDEYIKVMIEKELEFYKCIKEFTPPNMTERDYLKRNDLEWRELSERYLNVKTRLKQYESEEKYLREALVKASTGKASIGGGLKLSKIVRKGAIDYKIIPELIGIDLEMFRSDPVVSYRITETWGDS